MPEIRDLFLSHQWFFATKNTKKHKGFQIWFKVYFEDGLESINLIALATLWPIFLLVLCDSAVNHSGQLPQLFSHLPGLIANFASYDFKHFTR
jgi:hypothetical protein